MNKKVGGGGVANVTIGKAAKFVALYGGCAIIALNALVFLVDFSRDVAPERDLTLDASQLTVNSTTADPITASLTSDRLTLERLATDVDKLGRCNPSRGVSRALDFVSQKDTASVLFMTLSDPEEKVLESIRLFSASDCAGIFYPPAGALFPAVEDLSGHTLTLNYIETRDSYSTQPIFTFASLFKPDLKRDNTGISLPTHPDKVDQNNELWKSYPQPIPLQDTAAYEIIIPIKKQPLKLRLQYNRPVPGAIEPVPPVTPPNNQISAPINTSPVPTPTPTAPLSTAIDVCRRWDDTELLCSFRWFFRYWQAGDREYANSPYDGQAVSIRRGEDLRPPFVRIHGIQDEPMRTYLLSLSSTPQSTEDGSNSGLWSKVRWPHGSDTVMLKTRVTYTMVAETFLDCREGTVVGSAQNRCEVDYEIRFSVEDPARCRQSFLDRVQDFTALSACKIKSLEFRRDLISL